MGGGDMRTVKKDYNEPENWNYSINLFSCIKIFYIRLIILFYIL